MECLDAFIDRRFPWSLNTSRNVQLQGRIIMSNIVKFPTEKRQQDILNQDNELFDSIETYVDELASDIVSTLFDDGYAINKDEYIKDVSMMFESLRSLILKMNDLPHSFQYSADILFSENFFYDENQLCLDFGEDPQ